MISSRFGAVGAAVWLAVATAWVEEAGRGSTGRFFLHPRGPEKMARVKTAIKQADFGQNVRIRHFRRINVFGNSKVFPKT